MLFGEAFVRESVIEEIFTVSELIPSSNYSFRVAGVNSDGIGPFSDTVFIVTDGKNK